ncbi:hypothetical protein [Halobacillus sp. Marseille-Q1614]|uniref:hypothetical protein n=1 Tax=Halobacillus sp. Marseille-Q1614 TaxID=2709134 RepID=UPI00156F5EF7|nr:hypothetical protein [Halobacillus sp. Marseille-Q1614]
MANKSHDTEQELLMKKLMLLYLKGHIDDVKKKKKAKHSHSFIYIDNQTLQMAGLSMLLKTIQSTSLSNGEKPNSFESEDLSSQLDDFIQETKGAFEETIKVLKSHQ